MPPWIDGFSTGNRLRNCDFHISGVGVGAGGRVEYIPFVMDGVKRCDLAASGVIETIHYRFHNSKFPARTSTAATMQSGRRAGGGARGMC